MAILALDTSTEICSVALLLDDDTNPKELNHAIKVGHSGMLLSLVDELLQAHGCPRESIEHIAVGRGPGSFTGMRIGIATAKGLALALRRPLLGICSLDAMAQAALPSELPIIPVMDARKGEIFCGFYDKDACLHGPLMNLTPEVLIPRITQPTLLIGTALGLYAEPLSAGLGAYFIPGPQELWYPRAGVIAQLSRQRPDLFSTDEVIPLYVRASDATLQLTKKA
jgi:tRNA threonylcarbamoyladenosine biosynthesis protein TsaB